jgi:arginase
VKNNVKIISLIGVPTDVGAGVRGARLGPDALRLADLIPALHQLELTVNDCGNLMGPENPWQPAVNGFRHLPEVVQWNQTLHDAVYSQLQLNHLPMVLGGDHCLGLGSVSGVARYCRETGKKLRVIWFDAHADFNTAQLTPSGNVHGMPVACLCGIGPTELIEMSGAVPAITIDQLRLLGIRSVDPGEKRLLHETGVQVLSMRHIDEMGMHAAMTKVLEGVDEKTHLHVSFDVDFLDPSLAPGVATMVRGGPSYREAQLCMEMIADTGRLGSMDIMELNPALDHCNQTAHLVVDLVQSIFGKNTLI